jgi:TP901-1 family phage major tail protein
MAATYPMKGRSVELWRGSALALIAGVRTKSITISGEPIDITNDEDAGIRKLMEEPSELSVEIAVSGITKNDVLRVESLSTTDRIKATEFRFPGSVASGKLAGDFYLSSYSESGEYQGAATFEATFLSAGAVTHTAPT